MKMLAAGTFFLILSLSAPVFGEAALRKAPDVQNDMAALRSGAALFIDYCLNCHSLSFVRYNRLVALGFSERQIREMMTTADNPGETMRIAARAADQKRWFGVAPPDLSLIARSRASDKGSGADWLYAYMRSFHRDENRPTGWNNTVFANVAMPHVLWNVQGDQTSENGERAGIREKHSLKEYDERIAELVGFLVWTGEPEAAFRKRTGVGVMVFLFVFLALAYALKKDYWREIENEKIEKNRSIPYASPSDAK